jgi:outer membrane protein OmpA-like peptidoglycan-associated protein
MSAPAQLSLPLARRLALVVGLCAALPALAQAQVTYFKRPPTPEQLRAALLSPDAPQAAGAKAPVGRAMPSAGTRTRGIVWQASGAGAPALQAGATAVATPVAIATAPSPSQSPGSALMRPASGGDSPAAALPINFDLGSSRVDRESLPYIETIATLLNSDPSLQLVIEGHTDARGSYSRNMLLSWDRALGVYRTLVEAYGVEPRRLQPIGKGPLEPMPGTDPSDGSNRRVQFRIDG